MIGMLRLLMSVRKVRKEIDKLLIWCRDINYKVAVLEKKVSLLEENSHPPVFTKKQYTNVDERLQVIEAFFKSLEKVDSDKKNIAN